MLLEILNNSRLKEWTRELATDITAALNFFLNIWSVDQAANTSVCLQTFFIRDFLYKRKVVGKLFLKICNVSYIFFSLKASFYMEIFQKLFQTVLMWKLNKVICW